MMDNDPPPLVYDAELDANGLNCPLSLLKTRLELNRLPSDGVLEMIATDAGSQRDLRVFAQLAGHEPLREEVAEGIYRYWLRKR